MQGSSSPQSKRQKVFRACTQCVNAKTRCDDVLSSGCLICRKKHKLCSLSDISINTPSTSDGRVESLGSICRELEQRVMFLEDGLRTVTSHHQQQQQHQHQQATVDRHQPMLQQQQNSLTVPIQPRAIDNPLIDLKNTGLMVVFNESLFSASSAKGFPCVIARGLLTRDEVDMGFQVFKHRFCRILPLRPFLLASTPTPTNPFVILAILHHVPALSRPEFPHLVDESLLYCLTGAVNHDVVLALLILALAPEPTHASYRPHPTSLRLISLAYQVGLGLGLDALVENLGDLGRSTWDLPMLELAQMWSAVVNRYNILHIIQSQVQRIVPPIRQLSNTETDLHLSSEKELIDIVSDFITLISKSEATSMTSVPDVELLHKTWDLTGVKFQAFRVNQTPALICDSRCIQFGMACRLSSYIQRIPSPLGPIRQAILSSMGTLPPITVALVRLLKEIDLPPANLPSFVMYMLTFGLVYARRIHSFMQRLYPASKSLIDMAEVDACERKVHELGGTPSMILSHAAAAHASEDTNPSLELPEGFSLFDLVRWDFGMEMGDL